jgi:hypothetical protein
MAVGAAVGTGVSVTAEVGVEMAGGGNVGAAGVLMAGGGKVGVEAAPPQAVMSTPKIAKPLQVFKCSFFIACFSYSCYTQRAHPMFSPKARLSERRSRPGVYASAGHNHALAFSLNGAGF